MSIYAVKGCLNCGAPLNHNGKLLTCPYCDSLFEWLVEPDPGAPLPRPELLPRGLFEISLRTSRYRIMGLLGRGGTSEVLLARRASAVTEQVILKVADEREALEREWAVLRHLEGRCRFLNRLLPLPVALTTSGGKTVLVCRWRSGFVYNLAQVKSMFRTGIEPGHAVWMWNRILDQLTALGQLGYRHGSIRAEHLLVHPRDHGIAFCGWSSAALGKGDDLQQSGQVMLEIMPADAPRTMRDLARCAGHFAKPSELKAELKKVAGALYGPPRYRPFVLPGT